MSTYIAFNALHPLILCIDSVNIASTFWPITFLIFNGSSIQKKFWKAENQGFLTTPSNTMYVDTVNTSRNISNAFNVKMYWQCRYCRYILLDGMVGKPWFSAFQNFFQIENPLNIKEVISQNVLAMSTLSIQLKSPHCNLNHWSITCFDLLYQQCRHETQHTMHCLLCFHLCVSTVSTHAP